MYYFSKLLTTPAINVAAVLNSAQLTTAMSAHNSPSPPSTEVEAVMPTPRLLDSDLSRFRSLKRVIVVGRPGSGTDGIGDALKKLGFKVYDFQAASDRYERDFPLWLEAARLRQEGRPYSKSDYDKVIGDYDAIVGAPACFFDVELVKMYSGVKVILVTRDSDRGFIQELLEKVKSRFWQKVDPDYFSSLARFLRLNSTSAEPVCSNNDQAIREAVREKNLLEICSSIAWVPLCEFLGVKVPDAPAPEFHDNTTKAELVTRPQRWVLETAKTASHSFLMGLTYFFIMTWVTLAAAFAVFLGSLGLYRLSVAGAQFIVFQVARLLIPDVTRLLAVAVAFGTLIGGFVAGYSLALMRNLKAPTLHTAVINTPVIKSPVITSPVINFPVINSPVINCPVINSPVINSPVIKSPVVNHQSSYKDGYKRGKPGRGRQMQRNEHVRTVRPVLAQWSSVQDDIRKDDAEKRKESEVTMEEWKNDGTQATFNVTHKRTELGQEMVSGPRKVLKVCEEML